MVDSLKSKQQTEKRTNEEELHRHSNNLEEKVNLLADAKTMLQGTIEILKAVLEEMKALSKDNAKKRRIILSGHSEAKTTLFPTFLMLVTDSFSIKGGGTQAVNKPNTTLGHFSMENNNLPKDIMHEGNHVGIKGL